MVGPLVVALVSGGGSYAITKKSEEEKTERKLELIKDLADLNPEQSNAVEALKAQTVEEMEDRVTLGLGPFAELPAQASERAKEMREQLQAKMTVKIEGMPKEAKEAVGRAVGQLTEDEKIKIATAPDKEQAIKEVVDAKVEKVMQGGESILPYQAGRAHLQTF